MGAGSLLAGINKKGVYMMMTRLVTDYLDKAVERFPDKTAFVDERREMTFRDVYEEAERIAVSLVKRNYFKKPVAVFLDKQVECIPAFMGVAYSGNFYAVLDTKMPAARLEKIMHTLEPQAVITDLAHAEMAKGFSGNSEILLYEELMEEQPDHELVETAKERIVDTDVLYVLFTSGSTGSPKGVILPHRAVVSYIEWGAETFDFSEETILGNQTPFYFVMSGLDIYQTLRNGSTMYIIPKKLFSFPLKLLEYMQERKINTVYWVPSILCLIANFRALPELHLDDLRLVLFGGEVMPVKQLNMWRKEYPEALFANLYGQTEMTDVCAYYIVDREFEDTEPLPIGVRCRPMDLMVLGKDDKEAKKGEIGELCGRGPFMTYGYYNDPQKTKEAFVQNPMNTSYAEIIYRTGDLVKYNDKGELVYISRKDFQIKHMGHRIELGEIETAVSSIEEIDMNCCVYDSRKSKIVLFYVGDIDKDEIDERLREMLPEYMVPNKSVQLKKMPFNQNGKIDRKKLKEEML